MEVKAPHRTVKQYFALMSKSNQEIAKELRKLILREIPEAEERLKWGQPNYNGIYISSYTSHVNIGFMFGTELEDPDNMLEGTGKKLRHIKIHDLKQLQNISEKLKPLIKQSFLIHKKIRENAKE